MTQAIFETAYMLAFILQGQRLIFTSFNFVIASDKVFVIKVPTIDQRKLKRTRVVFRIYSSLLEV